VHPPDWSSRDIVFRRVPILKKRLPMSHEFPIQLIGINQKLDADDADLSGSTFRNVRLCDATFIDVNLSHAAISNANLSGASLKNANLSGLRISNANLSGASIVDSLTDGMTINGIPVAALLAAYNAANRPAP
jgi:uncharacterized protein YjbI with pentapeptide repeats